MQPTQQQSTSAGGNTSSSPSEGRSRNMQAIRRTDTKPERELRSALHRLGFRFRKDVRVDLQTARVRPDILFPRRRLAVFVDGCFWHSCPVHGRQPGTNSAYWNPKLARTVERDREADAALHEAGWEVVRVWEHEQAAEAVRRVTDALAKIDRAQQTG